MIHLTTRLRTTGSIVLSCLMCLFSIFPILSSCSTASSQNWGDESEYKDIHSMTFVTICLVPLDNISKYQMEEVKENLKTNFTDYVWWTYNFEILDGMASPDSCKNDLKTRLSAKRMISFLENHILLIIWDKDNIFGTNPQIFRS